MEAVIHEPAAPLATLDGNIVPGDIVPGDITEGGMIPGAITPGALTPSGTVTVFVNGKALPITPVV